MRLIGRSIPIRVNGHAAVLQLSNTSRSDYLQSSHCTSIASPMSDHMFIPVL